ncbi:unnamed protein product [Allacma fusca]|uniref:Uncharacterized protein n=1 Tax=Allacma fusca TaxID=39272 RepID=A0A8J2L0P1_9HEXA|nr:unnamed protein product [Allacma fusca]
MLERYYRKDGRAKVQRPSGLRLFDVTSDDWKRSEVNIEALLFCTEFSVFPFQVSCNYIISLAIFLKFKGEVRKKNLWRDQLNYRILERVCRRYVSTNPLSYILGLYADIVMDGDNLRQRSKLS